MITADPQNNLKIYIQTEHLDSDFPSRCHNQFNLSTDRLNNIQELKISGSTIHSFNFLNTMPRLQKIYFLACTSKVWNTLTGTTEIISLGLHNLKQGKQYLDQTRFLRTFPHLKYLYVNMLGTDQLPELPELNHLDTVIGVFRNQNAITNRYDFTSFETIPNLTTFAGYNAVDRHRIPAEDFIPVLKNKTLTSFTYSQMYATEDKKLTKLIEQYTPAISTTTLPPHKLMEIRKNNFAG